MIPIVFICSLYSKSTVLVLFSVTFAVYANAIVGSKSISRLTCSFKNDVLLATGNLCSDFHWTLHKK